MHETFEINVEEDTITSRTVYECQTTYNKYLWVTIIFVWKGLQLVYGAKLAWETRKVSVPELNDSKYIGLAIYNVAIPTAIVGPLANFLGGMPALSYILNSSCIIFCTTVTSCLIFLPKVIRVLTADPNDTNLQINTIANESLSRMPNSNRVAPLANGNPTNRDQASSSDRAGVKQLLKEKDEQISQLKKINEELRQTIQQRGNMGNL
ncbi:gamma-aminobutyric acid type B receptor subunit 1-like [Amphiura filiformis]|uniref:gamma-aminobutyric acid type B receptor subunit 1-like n=1 Tax=Amphiura filiformis TaxID=82378 RepID=UPI003B21456D